MFNVVCDLLLCRYAIASNAVAACVRAAVALTGASGAVFAYLSAGAVGAIVSSAVSLVAVARSKRNSNDSCKYKCQLFHFLLILNCKTIIIFICGAKVRHFFLMQTLFVQFIL